ncbi:MAG: RimK/LysX family protein [Actinomycetota bacterium]
MTSDAPTIGWREWVSLPQFSPDRIAAKVDTGAKTSCLHAGDLRLHDDGEAPVVSFEFHPDPDGGGAVSTVTAPVIDFREIRSSNGQVQTRPVIRTELALGDRRFEIDLTLTARDAMRHRVLLGRRFLEQRYRVDPGRVFLLTGEEATA